MFYLKRSKIQLSKHFNMSEFDCKCHRPNCNYTLLQSCLIRKLESARYDLQTPFIITSGFRCQKHNESVGGKPKSQHMFGAACDIEFPKDVDRNFFIKVLEETFPFIIVYRSFVHCDLRVGHKED